MKLQSPGQLSAILICGALAMACGSSDDPSQNTGPDQTTGGATEPGCNLNSGYDGDELCILPPEPGKGFQLHYGPPSYDDEAVKPFLLMPGEEMTDCFFVKSPNEAEIFTHEFHGRMRPGSHHMIVYAQSSSVADGLSPCNQGTDARFFVGSQTPIVDVPLPGAQPTPENDGLAMHLEPHAQMALNLHYINTTDKPVLREAWVNVVYTDPADVKVLMDPIFFLGGLAMNVQPNTEQVIKGSAYASKDLRILGGTGHFHAHTVRFSAWHVSGSQRTLILEDFDWHEPSNFMFDSATNNPAPDSVNKTAGAFSGILNVKQGDRIEWECHVVNDSSVTLTFANEVYTGEMCNLFGFYAPSMGSSWKALNL